jgi:alkanesulfonate monooxygenase SsuD/methylene tetrahydromethanopterin reductase-like flavin-dependent oxidoreductase (luciferase family)
MMTGCVVGRDASELRDRLARFKALSGNDTPPIYGTVDEVAERLRAYEAVGVERAMLQHLVHEDVEMVAVLGDVATHLG